MRAGKSRAPKKPERIYLEGRSYHKTGNLELAERSYRQVLKLIPRQPDALHMLGITAFQRNQFEEAERLMSEAIMEAPQSATLHYNHGNALAKLYRIQEAIDALALAFKLDPSNLAALKNLGNCYKQLNRYDKAIECYDQLLEIDPTHALARSNKAIALLTIKKFSEGFDLYDSRMDIGPTDQNFLFDSFTRQAVEWDGKTPDKPILVLPEQGLGDQIFYGGMLSDLEDSGKEAFVCLDERLIAIFRRSFPKLDFATKTQIIGLQDSKNLFGAQVMMGSMGRWLRRDEFDFRHIRNPYLKCDEQYSASLQKRLKKNGRLLIGISWSSKNASHGDLKSCSLKELAPILSLPHADFVDLQYGDTAQEREALTESIGTTITKVSEIDNMMDIEGLAALINACDIVITVSNTTVHLAAAMGKPTLVLLPHHTPLWYWHENAMDSPWYSTAVLLRQEVANDWSSPIARAATIVNGLKK
jgi:tetratricopeptide (TPR) repeat protein